MVEVGSACWYGKQDYPLINMVFPVERRGEYLFVRDRKNELQRVQRPKGFLWFPPPKSFRDGEWKVELF